MNETRSLSVSKQRRRATTTVGVAAVAGALLSPLAMGGSAGAVGGGLVPVDPATVPAPALSIGDTQASVDAGNTVAMLNGQVAAQAATTCTANYACVWVDANYGGRRGQFAEANASWGVFSNSSCASGTWKNCASSAQNAKVDLSFYLWTDVNYGGSVGRLDPGFKAATFSSTFNNNVESNFF